MPKELREWQPKKEAKELFVTFEYMQYKAAKSWGKTPIEWGLLSKQDKTIMMAFDKAENLIGAWHGEEMDKVSKIKKREMENKRNNRPKDQKRR